MSSAKEIQYVYDMIDTAVSRKIIHQQTDSEVGINGAEIQVNGRKLVNFGSCGYLGLETDPVLIEGTIKAAQKYGTQFSSSRAYMCVGLYEELERELYKIFQMPLVVCPTITLGHQSAMPVLVGENDVVILDYQVHASVQFTAQVLKSKNVMIQRISHNNMKELEAKIEELNGTGKYGKIWYMADGIYSMYGDFAPIKEMETLMNKYNNFYCYVDDAHGMSWMGKDGCGYVRSQIKHHKQLILAISLCKSFGGAGGCLVFPDEETKQLVRYTGKTMIFSGPIQPPLLGADIASAKLHQTQYVKDKQEDLKQKVLFLNNKISELGMYQPVPSDTPIFFIELPGPFENVCEIVKRMKENRGFYLNPSGFPAVPKNKGGVRFMVNCNHSYEDITNMIHALKEEYEYELSIKKQMEQIEIK